uniref:Uncharacterized protein n=1 Tax=Arundo donax TaxID=35708 RepID=A0A0A8Y0B6_ARUDO
MITLPCSHSLHKKLSSSSKQNHHESCILVS